MIDAENLIYDYPTKRALHGISFSVRGGETIALVGPNGAGKTTLLRLLAALDRPFSGTVRIDGVDSVGEPRRLHEMVGYLPDFYGLYDDLTVARCLTYAARARGVSGADAVTAVTRTAARIGLADRLEARARELSRGLRQRLAIGQSIVHGPRALLLDEPAAGLDPEARRGLSDLILQLAGEGMAIIVSSHILAELEDYCSAMLIIRDGHLVSGAPIKASSGGGRTRLRVVLAGADTRLGLALAGLSGFHIVAAEADAATLDAPADPAAWAQALSVLVGAGLAVAQFSEQRQTLEQAYLGAAKGTP
ncbi:MAG: ABC transporter ATP-binding protein [Caulobacterales bacterium]|jgi:ABC-2 type transport system ATP-binding protein